MHARLRREERRHGGRVAPIVSPNIVGENLLHGQFVKHRNLRSLIVMVIDTYSRLMCYVTLTIDHRVLDGYQANAFLARWVEEIEGWG